MIGSRHRSRRFNDARTHYAAWYYGSSNNQRCGAAAWPNGVTSGVNQQTPGHLEAVHRSRPNGAPPSLLRRRKVPPAL
jgi:hypothetical protein